MLTVHPHVCGELLISGIIGGLGVRFIPTCVGNSIGKLRNGTKLPVHPHVCGELYDL
ncbi:MAG: hypothetical protein PWQ49_1231 [Methanohalophilus sp.]|nr:hypothetical protein [Methanohalophilus sp.]